MTDCLRRFENACFAAGRSPLFNLSNAALHRRFGLGDFLGTDPPPADEPIAVTMAAVAYFCDGHSSTEDVFRFGVYAVTLYLHTHRIRAVGPFPVQAAADLVSLLKVSPCPPERIAEWARSNFTI